MRDEQCLRKAPAASTNSSSPTSSAEQWEAWIADSKAALSSEGYKGLIRGGFYLPNAYTRALTGSCGNSCSLTNFHGCRLVERKSPFKLQLSGADLDLAFRVLEHFDLVLCMELLSDARMHQVVARMLNLRETISIGKARANAAHKPPIPERVERDIRRENWLDLAIFDEWRQRNECAMSRVQADADVDHPHSHDVR